MKTSDRKYYLLNYVFLIGILLLFLNDHFFKWEFSNWLTGKLSDFIGILIFPMFLTYLFPRRKVTVLIFTGLFFIFWKSPYSQSFIEFYNEIALIKITRVVDYSDLIALFLLPFSYLLIQNIKHYKYLHIDFTELNYKIVLFLSVFIFMATSPPRRHFFEFSEGNLKFYGTTMKLSMSKKNVIIKLKQSGMKAHLVDSVHIVDDYYFKNSYPNSIREIYPLYFKVDTIVIDNDTIRDLEFSLEEISAEKTKIHLNGMNISKDIKEEEDAQKELRKYYRKILKKYIKNISKE